MIYVHFVSKYIKFVVVKTRDLCGERNFFQRKFTAEPRVKNSYLVDALLLARHSDENLELKGRYSDYHFVFF